MRLHEPLVIESGAPLARANPVAKLAAAVPLLVALFASLDGVTALVVLAGLVLVVPASGLSPRALVGRGWLIGVAGVSIAIANVLFAPEQRGEILWTLGPIRIGAATLVDGAGLAARLVAIGLAGILATATSQPTEVADALVQQLRVSPRFAIGALAALRLVPLLATEWQTIGLARRARGVDAGRSPLAAVRLFGGRLLALLVGAVRRGSRMALAMEARGFGAAECRTAARTMRMSARDWAWVVGGVGLAVAAVLTSVALGTWRPLLG